MARVSGIRNNLLAVALIILVPVPILTLLTYEALTGQLETSRWERHTFQVIRAGMAADARLLDLERALAVDLVGPDARAATDIDRAQAALAADMDKLRRLMSADPAQLARLERLHRDVDAWRQGPLRAVRLVLAEGRTAEAPDLLTRSRLMVLGLREQIGRFVATEERLLVDRTTANEEAERRTFLIVAFGGGLGVAFGLFATVVLGDRIARPLVRLRRAASAMAAGDRTQHVEEVPTLEEIGALATAFNVMVTNVTNREAALDRARTQTEALLAIAEVVGGTIDLAEALRLICRELARLTGAETVAGYLLDDAQRELRPVAGYSVPAHAGDELAATPVPLTRAGFSDALFREGRPVWTDDVALDPRFVFTPFPGLPHQSSLVIPLVVDASVSGVFYLVWWTERRRFDDTEIAALHAIGQEADVVVRNARLYADTVARERRLETLAGVTRTITESLDPEALPAVISAAVLPLFPEAACRLWLFVEDVLVLRAEAGTTGEKSAAREEAPRPESVLGRACRTRAPVIVDNTGGEAAYPDPAWIASQAITAMAAVPLVVSDRCIGVLELFLRGPKGFGAADVSLLRTFVEQSAVALEKVRLLLDAEQRRHFTERLHAMTTAMQESMVLDARLRTFVRDCADALAFDRVHVFIKTEGSDALELVAGTEMRPDDRSVVPLVQAGGLRVAWDSNQTLVVASDEALAKLPSLAPALRGHPVFRTRRFAVVPLAIGSYRLGLVSADNKPSRRPISERGVAQLEIFCQALATSVMNARLFVEAEDRKTRLEQIFAAVSDGILVIDLIGRVVELNGHGASLLGLPSTEVVGRPATRVVDALTDAVDWSAPAARAFRTLLHTPTGAGRGELEITRPTPRTLRWLATPTRNRAGEVLGVTITLQDVTRDREIDRMKTEFVSVVSHELRTPLTSIKGSLELLCSDLSAFDETQRELAAISLKNTERLVRLVNDILDISKMEAGQIQLRLAPHALGDIVRTAGEALAGFAESRGVRVDCEVAANVPRLIVDADRMVQVVTNLLSNAVKFSPPGGRVTVGAGLAGGLVEIRVTDRGHGIAAEDIPKLFRKFQQLDSRSVREVGGTGLGLVISRSIVEEHGGSITVESVPGAGATFIVRLPSEPLPTGAS